MKIAILLYPNMTALDAIGPYEVLRHLPDVELQFISESVGPVAMDSGVLQLHSTHNIYDTNRADILLIPGGHGERALRTNSTLLDWIRSIHAQSKWTVSVCTGSLLLASAGILDKRSATCHWAYLDELASLGANVVPERIVHDGKIMTAAGVSAGIDMALQLAGEIGGREMAEAIQLGIEYDPNPPFQCGHPTKAHRSILKMVSERFSASKPRLE